LPPVAALAEGGLGVGAEGGCADGVCGIGEDCAPLCVDGDELGLEGDGDGVEGVDGVEEDEEDEELLGDGVGKVGIGIDVLLLVCWEAQPPNMTAAASVSTGQTPRIL
jgi:hypothetical protein